MEALRCIIVDDNELDRLTLVKFLAHFPDVKICGVFDNAAAALEFLETSAVDLLFLDVDMPGMNGLELRRNATAVPICIFVTDYPEYAVESFSIDTLDYLIKPFTMERFAMTMARIEEYAGLRRQSALFENLTKQGNAVYIKKGARKTRVPIDEILYLNALQNYTAVVTDSGKYYVLSTLGTILKDIIFDPFVRIHKSYAVQRKHIRAVGLREIVLENGTLVPVGRSYQDNLKLLSF
ncbi:MAG: response regulator transcription factor [Flavobacterium sp.]|uniref:LytR/AlgR family response regulator transcription factor n=1 Tax=Flavobacterium sp. TaxID=239 RepID=UPI00121FD330|nr:LytTR family DNA-binding domain-containing protein [Flavobacterium sp.]RZJ67837.1 MAG: response regulator transcription factor [Flavobacterium sp.]